MSTTLVTPNTLNYGAIKPVSKFSKYQLPSVNYGVIQFNGADDILSEENYGSTTELTKDLYSRITKLSYDFAMVNLYFPTDAEGKKLIDMRSLRQVCKDSNVVFSFNNVTQMWRFLPMDVSIFQRVYESQNILQFTFYPRRDFNGNWNLDANRVQALAEKGQCKCNLPQEGIWLVEPWAKAEHVG